ncbi:alpha-N-arabinofuranosidase [Prauserella shujinwangii]|uniref:non-reducing end alpha-L-arabinofuranosidase n=1 Tax=Prauserella shujinwangii TaxID=1453103 RepID=A0A2T0LRU9_9PSEU|nr:alpha-N-arabinofuranosidase [Prauserella shujinwangii]PRX46182.1 alpha-N-arabinofuranosidase [Prauserella shujinwangii]
MQRASLTIDLAFRIADVDPRLYGSFVEHMGRCVYTGIYEPHHATADGDGFRGDVAELVRELAPPILRYPGGNFVSGYTWEDGIGARENRPRRLDLAWRSYETNYVGVDEFTRWARRMGSEPLMAVNLGTRGIDAACNLLEYANHPGGTYWSDLRRRNGTAEPHGIRLWCLGNEMDGPWQIGRKTAEEYARLAAETAKAMRRVDPSIELVACGSSHQRMPTFGTWEATVLRETYDLVDYVSLHSYYEQRGDDRASFLASAANMDRFIESVVATCDHVRGLLQRTKRINLSFDEWNVWYQSKFSGEEALDWAEHPRLIEQEYSMVDAVVVGSLLISLLRHADRVKIACLAQLVNVIAPIRSEPGGPAWRQTTYYPYALTSRHGRGSVLRVEPAGPTYETSWMGEVPVMDATAVHDEETGTVTLFAVNRDQHQPLALSVDVRSLPNLEIGEHRALFDDDPDATNTADRPDRVTPTRLADVQVTDGTVTVVLPALSWNMVSFAPEAS